MLEENDDEIAKSVMASVHGAAQHDTCPNPGNVAGAAKAGLKRGVDKRTETRLREANEGHRVIQRHQDALGKKNVPKLEQQADEIAEASYIANVELAELQHELDRLSEEYDRVLRTIDDEINDEKKLQADSASDADKKAAEARVKELEAAKEKVVAQKELLEEQKKQQKEKAAELQETRDACAKAKKTLDDKIEEKQKNSKPAAS
jgi:chromosome segregation ATPase